MAVSWMAGGVPRGITLASVAVLSAVLAVPASAGEAGDPPHAPGPPDPPGPLQYGDGCDFLVRLSLYGEGLDCYDAGLDIQIPGDWHVIVNNGFYLERLGRHDEALAIYNLALEVRPGDGITLHYIARTLERLGRHDEALAAYDLAIRGEPGGPGMLTRKADLLARIERHDQALVHLESLIEAHPWDTRVPLLMEEIGGR